MPLKKIEIQKKHVGVLIEWAQKNHPQEACALLLGSISEGVATICELFLTKNEDQSTVSFSIDPEELYTAHLKAEKKGIEIVAIFHSHPAPSHPSGLDLEFMRYNPIAWIILGRLGTTDKSRMQDLKAFQYLNEKLYEIELCIK
ncbi:MAG: Mov34/MPN/PAD-1 family protein [Candidatus Helarchaeota archaeon]